MKLEGKISILINADFTTIEIEDENANARFVTVKLTPEQLSMALSRQMSIDCELEVKGLEKVGKKHENSTFEFEITEDKARSDYNEELQQIAQFQLKDGWVAENYFGSSNSFFKKDGKQYARVTIRRWI